MGLVISLNKGDMVKCSKTFLANISKRKSFSCNWS